jgi:DNA-binding beta-propeller fold protein YncE
LKTLFAFALAAALAGPALAGPAYRLVTSVPLGAPERWDYVVVDPDSGRVYIAHGDHVGVLDGRAGSLLGQVQGISGGTHGIGLSDRTGQGFTDDGRNGQAVVFDLKTLQITKTIPANQDADAIATDPVTGHVFVIEGDPGKITVIDPNTDAVAATISGGEKMEYAVGSDGAVYVAGVEKKDFLKIDAHTNALVARWPTPDCESPHGLAIDAVNHRAFLGCENQKMMVIDTRNGRVVTELAIGRGNDSVAFDPVRKRVLTGDGRDGTVTVYQQLSADRYQALEPIKTQLGGRTIGVDPKTGRVFVPVADIDPASPAGQRPRFIAGSLKVMIFEPVG